MRKFDARQKLRQAVFAYIASQLLMKSEKESLARLFKLMDQDGDGKLSRDDYLMGYKTFTG